MEACGGLLPAVLHVAAAEDWLPGTAAAAHTGGLHAGGKAAPHRRGDGGAVRSGGCRRQGGAAGGREGHADAASSETGGRSGAALELYPGANPVTGEGFPLPALAQATGVGSNARRAGPARAGVPPDRLLPAHVVL